MRLGPMNTGLFILDPSKNISNSSFLKKSFTISIKNTRKLNTYFYKISIYC